MKVTIDAEKKRREINILRLEQSDNAQPRTNPIRTLKRAPEAVHGAAALQNRRVPGDITTSTQPPAAFALLLSCRFLPPTITFHRKNTFTRLLMI